MSTLRRGIITLTHTLYTISPNHFWPLVPESHLYVPVLIYPWWTSNHPNVISLCAIFFAARVVILLLCPLSLLSLSALLHCSGVKGGNDDGIDDRENSCISWYCYCYCYFHYCYYYFFLSTPFSSLAPLAHVISNFLFSLPFFFHHAVL